MADSANTARRLRMGMAAAVPTLAVVMSVPIAVAVTSGAAVQQEAAATATARAPAAVEASLGLDRPARRLIQQGLRNAGFDPGAPDGLFGPRTRAAIQDWQQSRGASLTGYLNGPKAELLRTASAPPPVASEAPPLHQLPPDVSATALSVAATPASTAVGTDSNPAPATVAAEVDPQNAATTAESRAATASGNAQLPPEIMVDRLLVRVDRLLRENDPGAAFEAMNEVQGLQEEHDLQLPNDLLPTTGAALMLAPPSRPGTVASPAPANAQLPPEILVDRHLVRVERLLGGDDAATAFEVMEEILSLQEAHDLVLPNDFHLRYAQVAFAAGQTRTAIAALNDYLVATGRDGEYYRQALELLDSAEVRLEREDAERTRDARWPRAHVFRDCEVCPEMVVMSGSLLALGRYEVTVAEYRAFASSTGGGPRDCLGGVSWRDPGYPQTDRHPVVCVNWFDAREYLSWLSRTTAATYRLPTEEEWARAATGSQPGCSYDRTGRRGACAVGSYAPNAAGLSDMASNVVEWTSDCADGDCSRRVHRGGSWFARTEDLQPDTRDSAPATQRGDLLGFRVARILD